MASSSFVQKAYIAFFNRPADREGFDHWRNHTGPDQDLLDLFAQSKEYLSDFAGKSYRETIKIIYQNLFGRPPENDGWNYWETQMKNGWVTVGNAAYNIMNGAQGTDLTAINTKTSLAFSFTEELNTAQKIDAYAKAGNNKVGHLAKEWLAYLANTDLSNHDATNTMHNLIGDLVAANVNYTPPPQNDTILIDTWLNGYTPTQHTLSATQETHTTVIWNVRGGNGTVKVNNFDTTSQAGRDYIDFRNYNAVGFAVATDTANGTDYYSDGNTVNTYQNWRTIFKLPQINDVMDRGGRDKYIVALSRETTSTTKYKVDLWEVEWDFDDWHPELDHERTVGYIDIGCEIDASVIANCILF